MLLSLLFYKNIAFFKDGNIRLLMSFAPSSKSFQASSDIETFDIEAIIKIKVCPPRLEDPLPVEWRAKINQQIHA
jgi:hypothetical protein